MYSGVRLSTDGHRKSSVSSNLLMRQTMLNADSSADFTLSTTRLQTLLTDENTKQIITLKAVRLTSNEIEQAGKDMHFVPTILQKIPTAWKTFVEDVVNDLRQVTSHVYDGAVSKGLWHGLG